MSDKERNTSEGGLAGVVNQGITNYMKDVHTALPGKIVSFDTTNQTAKVQLLIQRVFFDGDGVDLPQLINVPVWQPRAGGFLITFPIAEDDECLVLFSERSIDNWFKFGGSQSPKDWRMHSLSDAICLVGMSSEPTAIEDYDPDNLVIRNEEDDQHVVFHNNKDIEIATGTIVIQLDNSEDTMNIVAPTKVTVTTPLAEFSSNVNVGGNLAVVGSASSASVSTGGVSASSVSTTGDVSALTHTLTSPTSPPGTPILSAIP